MGFHCSGLNTYYVITTHTYVATTTTMYPEVHHNDKTQDKKQDKTQDTTRQDKTRQDNLDKTNRDKQGPSTLRFTLMPQGPPRVSRPQRAPTEQVDDENVHRREPTEQVDGFAL